MIVLGVDAGTQSVKVLAYDTSVKKVLYVTQSKIDIISKENGIREQKASWWTVALEKCLKALPHEIKSKAIAMGVSGQQHGFVPVAADGTVLSNVKLWCDTSTQVECNELTASFGGNSKLIQECGNPILPGYTASKILWFKKTHPNLFERMKYVMLPHDYINFYLTGIWAMERGDASGTGLMDIYSNKWNTKLCNIIDSSLIKKLPCNIAMPGKLGKIRETIAEELGINPKLIISTGGGDNMMAAIGTGTTTEGKLTMSLGTSGTLFTSSSKPITDEGLAAFASSHGSYMPLLCTMNCTSTSELIRTFFELDVSEFDKKVSKSAIGAEGIFMLPFFNGERVPNLPKGSGVTIGLNPKNMNQENYCRAAIEGVSYCFLSGLNSFKKNGLTCKTISLTGGGANSAVWRQIIADMTDCIVRIPEIKESAAFGAAIQAFAAVENANMEDIIQSHIKFNEDKTIIPNKEAHKKYSKLYEQWKSYVTAMTPFFS